MYDGHKIFNLPIPVNKLLANTNLRFPLQIDRDTSEILNLCSSCKHKGQKFVIKNGLCQLFGSIHKYLNDGKHNWNDFRYSDVFQAVVNLYREYEINPQRTHLNKSEVGVNVVIPFPPETFFKTVIMHEGDSFSRFEKEGAIGIWCKKTHHYIKIYDKSNQYPDAPGYTLRFELSSRKMDFFKGRINTISDYLKYDNFLYYGDRLQKCFDEIVTCDYNAIPKILNQKERSMFDQGTNYKFWENLNPDSKNFTLGNKDRDYKRSRKRYGKTLNNFKKLVKKYNLNQMQNIISKLINDKLLILNDYTPEIGDKVTIFLDQFTNGQEGQSDTLGIGSPYPLPMEGMKTLKDQGEVELKQVNSIQAEDDHPGISPRRYCQTCGRDISDQKDGSKFCSAKIVGYENAHYCRNTASNPRNNDKNKLERCKKQGISFLFDPRELLNNTG